MSPTQSPLRWVWGLALLVVGLVLLPFVTIFAYGLVLDPAYESRVVAIIHAPPEDLSRTLSDPQQQARWRPGVAAVEVLEPVEGRPQIQVTTGELKMQLERKESTLSRVVWEVVPSRRHVFEGRWTWDLAAEGAYTKVVLVEEGVITSPFARAAAESLFGLDRWSRASLARLAAAHRAEIEFE